MHVNPAKFLLALKVEMEPDAETSCHPP